MDCVSPDRYSEDELEHETIYDAVCKNIDFQALNNVIPKLHYPNKKKVKITKQELIDCL